MIDIKVFNDLGEDIEVSWSFEWDDVDLEDRRTAELLTEDPDHVMIRVTGVDDD